MFWGGKPPGEAMPEPSAEVQNEEAAEVLRRRRREARDAGMSRVEASLYAESEIPTEDLRHLVDLHCPAELLARVLL
jgi:hypothetical protein